MYNLHTSNEHNTNSECLFGIRVWCHISESNRGKRSECEIQGCDIAGLK